MRFLAVQRPLVGGEIDADLVRSLLELVAKALPKTKHAKALLLLAWHGRMTTCAEAAVWLGGKV